MPIRFFVVMCAVLLATGPAVAVDAAVAAASPSDAAPAPSGSATPPVYPGTEWQHTTPEAQGMRSAGLADMLEHLVGENPGVRSITVVRHGAMVLDVRVSPYTIGDRHDIHSCTKSVLSALVGIAIERGDLPGVDTPVGDFFPAYASELTDEGKRDLTLGHLLTMSAGLETEDSYLYRWAGLQRMRTSGDWTGYILGLPLAAQPGERFEYSNCVAQLIAIILQNATGVSAEAYAREHLFGPIGITDYAWETYKPGANLGYSGLNLHPQDMARIGYLYLRGGEWDGVAVVPRKWAEGSTSARISAGTMTESYGYQWWVERDMYMMLGYGGQLVFVLPDHDLVAVFTSALPQRLFSTPRRLLMDYIVPAIAAATDANAASTTSAALPANPSATARLDSLAVALGSAATTPPQPMPYLAKEISGRAFEFEDNRRMLQRLTLHFTPGASEAGLDFVVGGVNAHFTIGLDGAFRMSEMYGQRWACRGHWKGDNTFVLEQEHMGKVIRREITMDFEGGALSVDVYDPITNEFETLKATMAEADSH